MTSSVKMGFAPAWLTPIAAQTIEDEEIAGLARIEEHLVQLMDSSLDDDFPAKEEELNEQIQVCFIKSAKTSATPFRKSLDRVKEIIQLRGESPAEGYKKYQATLNSQRVMNYHKILLLLIYKHKKYNECRY